MAKGDGYLLVGARNSQSAVTIIAASGTEMLITDIGDSSTNYSGIFMFDTTQTNYRIPLMSTSRYGGSYGYIFGNKNILKTSKKCNHGYIQFRF